MTEQELRTLKRQKDKELAAIRAEVTPAGPARVKQWENIRRVKAELIAIQDDLSVIWRQRDAEALRAAEGRGQSTTIEAAVAAAISEAENILGGKG